MSRPVIPPLHPPVAQAQAQSHQTSEVLRRRLVSAEEDAWKILDQLGNAGQPRLAQIMPHSDYGQSTALTVADRERRTATASATAGKKGLAVSVKPPLPSEGSLVEPGLGSFSQDALISRVCKLESMLQTLKVGLAGATSAWGGSGAGGVDRKRLKAEVEERVGHVKQELGSEVVRLKRQVASLQEDLSMESEARARLREESEKLKEALEEATQARV